jgi:hypothetical protein
MVFYLISVAYFLALSKIALFSGIDQVTYLYSFVISLALGKTGSEYEFQGILSRCRSRHSFFLRWGMGQADPLLALKVHLLVRKKLNPGANGISNDSSIS